MGSAARSKIDGSSFSGLFTRAEIGHIVIRSAGNGRSNSHGSGPRPSYRSRSSGPRITGIRSWI